MSDYDEAEFAYLAKWAARHGLALKLEGEVGFGRECVGIAGSNGYVDYAHTWTDFPDDEFWSPEDAYHKHDCLAVLGRGREKVHQLYEWVRWLDEHGWTVETVARTPENALDAMLHGVETVRLTKLAAAPAPGGGS